MLICWVWVRGFGLDTALHNYWLLLVASVGCSGFTLSA